ncbi:uncharacterized protein BDR25DRAFT_241689 [Lindgomyces ingoldianus]|uniref:Uncharacterized protein n=1 Tax=Lindgomyces ingoldianus TaxID=673940 RepID=A0ACB6QDK8_9PLEO|nr:uncharacterized protein BDR25DRAFT_241689 [Lindgomyces ingoldianus]KAF2464693.1 hypothetical protein BDR25DRAFT_241689 [Lindgomyces ingoldianus]
MASPPSPTFLKQPHRNRSWKQWPLPPLPPDSYQVSNDFELSQYPELEDESLLAWGLKQSELEDSYFRATVTVLQGRGMELKWHYNVDDDYLDAIISVGQFFVNTWKSMFGWLPGNFSIPPRTVRSLRRGGLSGVILRSMYSSEGFWAKMGNQCFLRHGDHGKLASFESSYRYQCGWDTGIAYTQFIRTRHRCRYFCINYPALSMQRLTAYLKQNSALGYRPFFLEALAADECLKEFQRNIGDRRKLLVQHERTKGDKDIDFNTATTALHRLSRDWHTLGQDCQDFYTKLQFLQDAYMKYMRNIQDPKNGWKVDKFSHTDESLEVLKSQCDNFVRWTSVYRDRTNIRINLLFHLANQRESRTSTQIASSSAKIAEQTQRDSSSMITIATVTMFFLPGTFISAILSTTFFDFGPEGLSVSRQWWILPATTIPVMIIVFGVWLGWRYWRFKKKKSDLKLP